jgi:hypothetical protein
MANLSEKMSRFSINLKEGHRFKKVKLFMRMLRPGMKNTIKISPANKAKIVSKTIFFIKLFNLK